MRITAGGFFFPSNVNDSYMMKAVGGNYEISECLSVRPVQEE